MPRSHCWHSSQARFPQQHACMQGSHHLHAELEPPYRQACKLNPVLQTMSTTVLWCASQVCASALPQCTGTHNCPAPMLANPTGVTTPLTMQTTLSTCSVHYSQARFPRQPGCKAFELHHHSQACKPNPDLLVAKHSNQPTPCSQQYYGVPLGSAHLPGPHEQADTLA